MASRDRSRLAPRLFPLLSFVLLSEIESISRDLSLCRATQFARASASATVPIASTSTALYSPKIKVDVIGSKPNASPKGFGRSPTIAFPRGGKNVHSKRVRRGRRGHARGPFSPFAPSIWYPFRCQRE